MKFETSQKNKAHISLAAKEHLYFKKSYLGNENMGVLFKGNIRQGALWCRFISSILFFAKREAEIEEKIVLNSELEHEFFHHLSLKKDEVFSINLNYLVAYTLAPGTKFKSKKNWFKIAPWLIGQSRVTLIEGEADLLLCGRGLKKGVLEETMQSSKIVAFNAKEGFRIRARDPGNNTINNFTNALSNQVLINFDGGHEIIYTSVIDKNPKLFGVNRATFLISSAVGSLLLAWILGDFNIFTIFKLFQ